MLSSFLVSFLKWAPEYYWLRSQTNKICRTNSINDLNHTWGNGPRIGVSCFSRTVRFQEQSKWAAALLSTRGWGSKPETSCHWLHHVCQPYLHTNQRDAKSGQPIESERFEVWKLLYLYFSLGTEWLAWPASGIQGHFWLSVVFSSIFQNHFRWTRLTLDQTGTQATEQQ